MKAYQRRSFRWVVLSVATIAQATTCFLVQGLGALSSYLQASLGLSAFEVGMLMASAQCVPLLGLLVAGELLDRFNERQIVGVGALLVAASLLMASFTTSYHSLLAWLAIVGLGYSTAQPGGSKSISGWFSKSQRGFAMGVRQAGLPLGGAIAAASLPLVASNYGWRVAFQVGAGISFIGAILFILVYRSPAERHQIHDRTPQTSSLRSTVRARLMLLRLPHLKNIIWSGVPSIATQYGIVVFLALYLHEHFNVSTTTSTIMLFVAQAAGVVGRIAIARWGDRSQHGRLFPVTIGIGALLLGLGILLTLSTASWLELTLLSGWLGFFGFGWYGSWVTYVSESVPAHREGFMLGLAMAINQIAVIGIPPVFGFLRDATGSYTASWLLLMTLLLGAFLSLIRE